MQDESSKEDRSRVKEALAVKNEEVREKAEGFTKAVPEQTVNSTSSVDFGNTYNLPHPLWRNEYIWRVKVSLSLQPLST